MTQGIENIEIYNPIGGSYGTFPVTDKCERSVTLMGDDYVKLAFSLTKQRFQFEAFSYIVYDGKHYFLPERYRPTPQGSNYDYAMTFVSAANMLSKSLFMRYYQVPTEEDPTVFRDIQPEPDINVNADLIDITTILLRSIQGASDRVPVFSNTKTIYAKMIAGMTLDTDDMIDGTELKTFTFESNNIEEVLNNIAEQYKTEWWITESAGTPVNLLKLHICKCEQRTQSEGGGSVLATPTVLSDVFIYKDGEAIPYSSKGLLSVGYAQEWSNIPQRIIPFGSDRNIIRTQALDKLDDKDVYVSYGKRLRLNPNHQVTWQGAQRNGYVVKQKDGTDDFLPVGSFGEVNNPNVTSGIEKTELFDDIYPQGHFLVTKCELSESGTYFIIEGKAIKQNTDGTPMKEDGEYVTYTWREMCTPLGEDVFTPGDKKGLGLVPLQNKNQTEDLTIHFESGWLNGREFGVSRNNGIKETEDGVEVQVLSLDIVPDGNEDEALALPNANFYPQVGDMFAIFNMDMPQGYIDMAEQRLAQATYEKLIEYQNSRPDVKCKSEPTFFSKLSAMLVGKRFAVFSELFGDIVYIDDDPDKGIDEEHSAVFTSRVTAYSHSLTNPASIDFTLASGMVAGRLASIEAMISDTSSELRGLEQRHINLSKRGWHDAEELSQMLESLTTEMMLVGNAKYQFGYTFGIVLDNDSLVISNVKHTKSITVQGGGCLQHTQKPYIDYPNQGLWYVDETEINLYQSNGTPIYDPTKPYYLYAIVNNTGARLTNQDIVLTETEQNGDMYMLLGVLSSEFEDEVSGQKTSYRIFSRTNGFTAIEGGTITTEQIQDANRQLIIDFQSYPPRIIARGGAEIIGNITFKSFKDASTGRNPLEDLNNKIDQEIDELDERISHISVGGRNLVRDTAFSEKAADINDWTFYNEKNSPSTGKTLNGGSFKTNADDSTVDNKALQAVIKKKAYTETEDGQEVTKYATNRIMLTQTGAIGDNEVGDYYTFSALVKATTATTLYFGAGYSNFNPGQDSNQYGSAEITTAYTRIVITAKVFSTAANYKIFFLRLVNGEENTLTFKEVKLEKGTLPTSWTQAPEDIEEDIAAQKSALEVVKTDLQNQIDGVVDSYFMEGVPTMQNAPASDWSQDEYQRHEGDTYTNIQSYNTLDVTQWEQGRVYYGTNYTNVGKTLDQCKSATTDTNHANGYRCKGLIEYKAGDTLLLNTNSGAFDVLITYYDTNGIHVADTYYSGSQHTTVEEVALNTSYTKCNISIRKSSAVTADDVRALGLCVNPTAGHSWRFCNSEGTGWHWHEIADSDAVKALQDAAAAQATADGKMRFFATTPYPPYQIGDMWAKQNTVTENGESTTKVEVLYSTHDRTDAYVATDWVSASEYAEFMATEAQSLANAAQQAADDAMAKAQSISNDGIISGGTEKQVLKREFVEIAGEDCGNNISGTTPTDGSYRKALAVASTYNITSDATYTALTTAYGNLRTAMQTVFGVATGTTNIDSSNVSKDTYLSNDDGTQPTVPSDADYLAKTKAQFNALWKDYYDAEIALLNKASSTIDGHAQSALNQLADMASDGKLTAQEKLGVKREWLEIIDEKTKNRAEAVACGLPEGAGSKIAALDTAYTALQEYLLGKSTGTTLEKIGIIGHRGTISSTEMGRTTPDTSVVSGETFSADTFNTKFKDFYNANIDLLNAISTTVDGRAKDAMKKAEDIANDGIISGGTEKATIKKEWQEIAGDNMLGNNNGSYKKALDQAAAYGITVDTNSAIKTAYRALDDAMWIVIGYNGDTDAWTDEYMHVDTYLKNDDGTAPTVPTGANYLAKKRSEFSALWRAYYDAEIALLNTVSDTIDQKEIGGENLLFVNNVNRVEGAQDPEGVFKYELTYYSGSGNSRQHTYLPAGKYVFSAKDLSYGCEEQEWICQVHLEAINSSGTVKKSIYLREGDIRDKLIEFTEPCYIALQLEMWTHEEHTQTQGFVSISNMQLQKGTKSTSYQNYMEHLANAIKGTTEINGGLVMLNVLMLKNEQGEVTAGMSGLKDDNVTLWGGGSYLQALQTLAGTAATPIPVMLTKTGAGSRIGCFRVVDNSKIEIRTEQFGLITIDTNTDTGGIIVSPKIDGSFKQRILIIPRNVDSYKAPQKKNVSTGQSGSTERNVGSSWTNEDEYYEINVPNDDNQIVVSCSFPITGNAYHAATGYTDFHVEAYLQRYENGVWSDYDRIAYANATNVTAGDYRNITASGSKTYNNLPAGVYRVQGRAGQDNSGGLNLDIWSWSWRMEGYYYPFMEPKTVIGRNGIIVANTRTRYFQIVNESGSQQVIMAGLPTSATGLNSGQLYRDGNYLKIV